MARFKSKAQIEAEAAAEQEETERETNERLRQEYLANKFAWRKSQGLSGPVVEVRTDVTGRPIKGEE